MGIIKVGVSLALSVIPEGLVAMGRSGTDITRQVGLFLVEWMAFVQACIKHCLRLAARLISLIHSPYPRT